jgi:formate C-acetyltransferase
MAELLEGLKSNWEGKEDLRRLCLSAPKFGNDDDYVDLIAKDLHYRVCEAVRNIRSYFGTPMIVDGSVASAHYAFGIDTWATPDGRRSGDSYHDGSIAPMMGRDVKGPTAALKSISKIDVLKTTNHLYNQSVSPQFLVGHNAQVFADYLKTWLDLGIHHIQFSVVDREEMLDAQVHPEEHADLIVRVCGYSAYFVDLSKGLQDTVIERTMQCF